MSALRVCTIVQVTGHKHSNNWVAPQQNAFPKTQKRKTLQILKINWSTKIIYFTIFHRQTNHLKPSLCLLYIIQYWWAKGPITDKPVSQPHLRDLESKAEPRPPPRDGLEKEHSRVPAGEAAQALPTNTDVLVFNARLNSLSSAGGLHM